MNYYAVPHHILLYEPSAEHSGCLNFLLNLVDIRYTWAKTAEEALGLLKLSSGDLLTIDLILVSSLSGHAVEGQLMKMLLFTQEIPLVFIQRGGRALPEYLIEKFVITQPSSLLVCLSSCLRVNKPVLKASLRSRVVSSKFSFYKPVAGDESR